MNALRLLGERRRLVVQQMGEARPADFLQSRLDGHRRIEGDRFGVNDRRCRLRVVAKPVAPLRLAARLDADRCHIEQSQGDVIKSSGVTAPQFELDLADRLGLVAAGGADLALVDRSLYSRCRGRLDGDRRARHVGREERLQRAGNPFR